MKKKDQNFKEKALRAFSLNNANYRGLSIPALQREADWAEKKPFGWPPASCPPKQPRPVTHFICGLRVGTRGLEPPQGHPGKWDLLGGLWVAQRPTLFSRSIENEHTSPRRLKGLPRGPESLSGALSGLWEGVSESPNYWNEGSNSEAPKGPQAGFRPSCSAPRATMEHYRFLWGTEWPASRHRIG